MYNMLVSHDSTPLSGCPHEIHDMEGLTSYFDRMDDSSNLGEERYWLSCISYLPEYETWTQKMILKDL